MCFAVNKSPWYCHKDGKPLKKTWGIKVNKLKEVPYYIYDVLDTIQQLLHL